MDLVVVRLLFLLSFSVGTMTFNFGFFGPPAPQPQAGVQQDGDDFTLTILHTNDVHARFQEFNANGGPCTDTSVPPKCYGGVARRYTMIQEIRDSTENVLLIDAGDQFQGTLWFAYYGGRAANYFMNKMQYDVMTLGNHEFDRGVVGLVPFLQNVSFPVVNSNIDASKDDRINGLFNKSVVLSVGGRKVGIVGVVTAETPDLVNPKDIEKLVFKDEVASVQEEVKRLKESGVNIIIVLSHSGFGKEKEIAEKVDGIDVVVGGHTNTFLYTGTPPDSEQPVGDYPFWVNSPSGQKVAVVQEYTYGKYLGMLKVTFNAQGTLLTAQGNPILLDNSVAKDTDITRDVEEWLEPLINMTKTKVGSTLVYLEGRREVCRLNECNMGNAMTEAMILEITKIKPPQEDHWAEYSIAIWNGGGIRNSIDPGDITMENVLSVFPFQNSISGINITGDGLRKILEHSVADYNPLVAPGAFLQVSGLRISYDLSQPPGQRVIKVDVRCARCKVPSFSPLETDKVYNVITSDFLINGGDRYAVIKENMLSTTAFSILDSTVFSNYCRVRTPITQGIDNRIHIVTSGVTSGMRVSTTYSLTTLLAILYMIQMMHW